MSKLTIEGVEKNFSDLKALNNINLEIESGEFFTLLGPSGCGKTTLLRTIAGFNKQDKGKIFIGGKQIDNIPAFKRDTGMVFQDYAIFPHMTTYENVAFGLKNRKIKAKEIKERVEKALERARLEDLAQRTPDQLSGGQQQRVGLARAMVIEPQVLLMDEPLSNLDAKLRIDMREEIRDIQKALGVTTIYVTHDQEEALVISDRIAVMNKGEIQQIARPWEIYNEPENKFVGSFIGHMNILEGDYQKSQNDNHSTIKIGNTIFKVNHKLETTNKVQLALRPEDVTYVKKNEPRQEDHYNYIKGIVTKISFTGAGARFYIDCGDGIRLTMDNQKPSKENLSVLNDTVDIKIPIDIVMVFDSLTEKILPRGK
jgi:iron(III) transport system ATP-binding protein